MKIKIWLKFRFFFFSWKPITFRYSNSEFYILNFEFKIMLFFENLKILDTHIALLQKRIKDNHSLFLVGWCVRDPLLWLDKKPTDIDFTMAGEPKKIDKLIDKIHIYKDKTISIVFNFENEFQKHCEVGVCG